MSDFKEGDEIWWFEGPDQNLITELQDLELCHSHLVKEENDYIWTKECCLAKVEVNAYFKSKGEAINALVNYLVGL